MSDIEQVKQESNDSQSIGERVREHLPVGLAILERRARARWIAIPVGMRSALDELLARVRRGLDLPSRADIDDLLSRIDHLDSKLAQLESARAARPQIPVEPKVKAAPKAKAKAKPKAKAAPKAKPKAKAAPKVKARATVANKTARRAAIERAAKHKPD